MLTVIYGAFFTKYLCVILMKIDTWTHVYYNSKWSGFIQILQINIDDFMQENFF